MRAFFIFGLLSFFVSGTKALETTPGTDFMSVLRVDAQTLTVHDPDYQLSPQKVVEYVSQPDFQPDQWVPAGLHYWFYTPLRNISNETKWAIRANNILYNSLEFYLVCDGQSIQSLPRPETGITSPSLSSSLYIPIELPRNADCGFIQEASTVSFYPLQTYLMTQKTAQWQSNLLTTLTLLGLGFILGLIVYNLLLSITLFSATYFSYVIYASVHFSLLWLISWRPESMIPDFWQPMHILRFLSASLMVTFILFTNRFIRLGLGQTGEASNRYQIAAKFLSKFSVIPIGIMCWFALDVVLWPERHPEMATSFPRIYILCSLYIPVVSLLAAMGGYRSAWAFVPAWSILVGSHIIGTMDLVGVISLDGWARVQAIWGGAVEMALLSIALGMRLKKSNADKQQAELELVIAERFADKQEKFISTLSHEIRTPLHAMLGATGLLGKTSLTELQKRYWGTTHYAAESMHALVDNLLDRAQIKDSVRFQQQTQTFEPDKLIFSMVELLKNRAEEKGLTVDLQINNLPIALEGYPVVLRRVLINVISNSVKYTSTGSITVTANWQAGELNASVVDTGVGMSMQQLKELTRDFQIGVDTLYSHDPSSGLGLPICHELVAMVNGSLTVSSDIDKGTCVEFSLPMTRIDKAETQSSASKPDSSLTILAVDDVESNRMILQALLSADGHHVAVAQDGQEALDLVANQQFDLILSDLRMPKLSGEELLKCIKNEDAKHTPIFIVTSAHINDEQQQRLDSLGADAYLRKPYTPIQLSTVIRNHLQQSNDAENSDAHETTQQKMKAHLGDAKYQTIMQLYRQQLAQDLDRIKHGLETLNRQTIKVSAHRIVSASQALGLKHNAKTASAVEDCIDTFIEQKTENWSRLKEQLLLLLAKVSISA